MPTLSELMEMSAAAFERAGETDPEGALAKAIEALRDYAQHVKPLRHLRFDLNQALTEIEKRQGDLAFVPHWRTGVPVDA